MFFTCYFFAFNWFSNAWLGENSSLSHLMEQLEEEFLVLDGFLSTSLVCIIMNFSQFLRKI